ncbi:MAG: MFS transporter [Holophaga sp.]|nr:MFS transporter [Holophaga sp.]
MKSKELSPLLVLVMAAATGLAVGSNYYAQPLLPTIAHAFAISPARAGFIVTTAQMGYGLGLLLIVPLGDLYERRGLVVGMSLLTVAGLLTTAMAPSITLVLVGTALTGLFSVVAQLLVPFAATLAAPERRGKAVGTVMSGLFLGILLARTLAGALANLGSWRIVYWAGAAAMLLATVVLQRALPRYHEPLGLSYPQLMRSIFTLFREEPVLRLRGLLGAATFGAFSTLWTSVSFLLAAPPYGYSAGTIGLFGLAGVAGALAASGAGRLSDRGHGARVTGWGLVLLLLSWGLLVFGRGSLAALVAGILLLDLAVQAVHISNQAAIYRIRPEARNRLTAGYMTCYFIGGAACSLLSAWAYGFKGWVGVSAAGAAVSALGLITWLVAGSGSGRQPAVASQAQDQR